MNIKVLTSFTGTHLECGSSLQPSCVSRESIPGMVRKSKFGVVGLWLVVLLVGHCLPCSLGPYLYVGVAETMEQNTMMSSLMLLTSAVFIWASYGKDGGSFHYCKVKLQLTKWMPIVLQGDECNLSYRS
ncbi:hypothetical protein MRB53_016467 [Persea americana]|uniref:Uncharacterized protein n=1 Tax=Persea americana TaxID=3435 RepID=A0ACC2M288_PERAE|nr:hypothetical protein MRB53_016467 [Persea americana]